MDGLQHMTGDKDSPNKTMQRRSITCFSQTSQPAMTLKQNRHRFKPHKS